MIRVITLDARRREIAVEHVPDAFDSRGQLLALQQAVGGYIEVAHRFANGDSLMVNEEGRLLGLEHGFALSGAVEPSFAGDGVIVGLVDDNGDITDVRSTVAEIAPLVGWLVRVER